MADQSTDLSTTNQPAGTTSIDNGIAYDVAGKPLGPANMGAQEAAPPPPPGFKPVTVSGQDAPPPPPGFKPVAEKAEQSAAPAPKAEEDSAAYKSLKNFAGAFNLTLTGSEDADSLKKKVSDYIQSQPPGWTKNFSPQFQEMTKAASGVIGMAKGAYDSQKHEMDTGIAQMQQPGIANKASGAARYAQGLVPFIGPAMGAIEDNFANGDYAKGLGTAFALLVPGAAEHYGPGLIEDLNSRAAKVATTDTKRLIQAAKTQDSAKVLYDGRTREHNVAVQQVKDAETRADAAREAQVAGTGTKAQADEAATNASAARANLGKAESAVTDARDAHANASVRVEQLTRKAQASLGKAAGTKTASPEQVEKSHSDFEQAIPSGKGKSAYTRNDLVTARPILEAAHADTPIDSPEAVVGALESDRVSRDNQVLGAVDKYKNEPIRVEGEDGKTVSLKQKLVDSLKEDEAVRPGFTEAALKELERFNTTDMSVGEADALRKSLNTENRDMLNTSGGWRDVADARETDPKFAARYELQEILRNGVYGTLEDKGVEGARESRKVDASVIRIKNAALRQLNKPGTIMRGTGEAGPVRRAAAWAAEKAGIAGGVAAGAATGIPGAPEVLGVAGGGIGGKISRALNPGDLTRSEQLGRSLKVRHGGEVPTIDVSGSLPSNPPAFGQPPAVEPPVNPRENTELHAQLVAHYDEDMGDSTYSELEQRLLEDIAIKKKHGVPVDPAEKKLNLDIQKSKVEEIQKARGQHEEQLKVTAKAAAEAQKQQEAAIESRKTGTVKTDVNPELDRLGRGDESALVSHSPAMKAHSPASVIPGLPEGVTSEDGHIHEWAHMAIGSVDGLEPVEIRSDIHPKSEKGAGATAVFNGSALRDAAGNIDPEALGNQETQWLTQKMAGPASHEVFKGMTRDEVKASPATRSDFRTSRAIVREVHPDFTASQVEAVVDAAYERARDFLTKPHIADRIRANAAVREDGLSQTLHASHGRVSQFAEDIRNAHNEYTGTDVEPDGGGAGEGVEKAEKPAAEEGKKDAGRSEERGGKGTPKPASEAAAARGVVESEVGKIPVPKETTTGKPEVDEAIRAGGGIPGGIQKGFEYKDKTTGETRQYPDTAYVHEPTSGTSLNFPIDQITSEFVKQRLDEKRAEYAAAEKPKVEESQVSKKEEENYHPDLQAVANKYGTSTDPTGVKRGASFIAPDGKFIHLGATEHPVAIESATNRVGDAEAVGAKMTRSNGPEDSRIGFLKDTGAIRTRFRSSVAGKELVASVPAAGVSEEQISALRQAVGQGLGRDGNFLMEVGEPGGKSATKEFASPRDVEPMLREIGAHPEQKAAPESQIDVHEKTGGSTFTPEGKNLAGSDLHAVAPYPERSQVVDKLTPENLAAYKAKNADLLSDGEHAVGTWKDPESGKTYLDISKTIADRQDAIRAGQDANQKAIYNLKTGETIPTGGTGEAETPFDVAKTRPERVAEIQSRMDRNLRAGDNQYKGLSPEERNIMAWDAQNGMDQVRGAISKAGARFAGGPLADGRWNVQDPETGQYATVSDLKPKSIQDALKAARSGQQMQLPDGSWTTQPDNILEMSQIGKSPKGSSVPLMTNPLEVKGTGEKGRISTLDVAQALNDYSKEKNPALEPGSNAKTMTDRAQKIAEDEAKYQLAQGKTGTEWYTTEMKDHDAALQGMRPELAGGETLDSVPGHPVKLSLFKAAEAVLSSGQKPYGNFKAAVKAWDAYNETGKFPRLNPATGKSWGPRGEAAYGNALDMINKLVADKGEKGAAEWLLTDHPVSELKELNSTTKGKKTDMRPGAIILGEKRGPFMQNLHGIESAFTADMWVSRTWNRWMGTMEFGKDKEGVDEIKSDSPRNGAERDLMKQSFEGTAKKLGLTTSSLQAVLWYYEQALYGAQGIPKESWSFRDAAQRAAKEEAAVPEAEQTGFQFGANKEKGGISNMGSLTANPKFDALGRPFGGGKMNLEESHITQEPTYTVPKGWSKTGPAKAPGMISPGNIDLTTRPVVKNDDGTTSSEYSTSMEDENGHEVLVPTVVNGKFLTPDGKKPPEGHHEKQANGSDRYVPSPQEKMMFQKAWQHYKQTGQHLGIFDNGEHADAAADAIHSRPPVKK
jgi:hypothetical protein